MAFNIFLFAFVYFIPLIVLITSNTVIYLGLKRMRANIAQGVNTALSHKRIEMEQRILKSSLFFSLLLLSTRCLSRHHHHCFWLSLDLDTLRGGFLHFCLLCTRKFDCVSLGHIHLCLLRQIIRDVDSSSLHQYFNTISLDLRRSTIGGKVFVQS